MKYRIAFFFKPEAKISLKDLSFLLTDLGERTMKVVTDDLWQHKRYKSSIWWSRDVVHNIINCTVSAGEASRTCGSLVEWILRNLGDLLDDSDKYFEGIAVFAAE